MKNTLLSLVLITYCLLSAASFAQTSPEPSTSDNTNTAPGMSESQLLAFCTDKPIWSAFAISPETCLVPATACAKQEEFQNIDPVLLSEPFYNCVFKGLGIEI